MDGVDHVYIFDETHTEDLEARLKELEIILTLIDEPCRTILERVMCFYVLPPCGNSTHFIPPQAICSEDCFNAAQMCPEVTILNSFVALDDDVNVTVGLNCSQPGMFIDPLPHCCVAGTYISKYNCIMHA